MRTRDAEILNDHVADHCLNASEGVHSLQKTACFSFDPESLTFCGRDFAELNAANTERPLVFGGSTVQKAYTWRSGTDLKCPFVLRRTGILFDGPRS